MGNTIKQDFHAQGIAIFGGYNSQKQPYPIGENDKDIRNNIKNRNNYNKESLGKKNNKANFDERDYTSFDFTKLYANADAFV